MTKRMWMALVALVGAFLAAYLTLYKLGYIGSLACGTGGCETVQTSRWALLLRLPVAAWGVGFYLAVIGISIVGLQERFDQSRAISLALLALTGWGVLFSAWLTYVELFRIHAICRYCVVSAGLVVVLFVLALSDYRERRTRA